MITPKQIKQLEKIFGNLDIVNYLYDDKTVALVIGDIKYIEEQSINTAFGWDMPTIDFVRNTTPEERKEIKRLARISALEKELEELKSDV